MVEPGTRLGPYEIVAPVGAGGMGEVYRAHDTRLGRDVALKILTPAVSAAEAGRKRFLREARTISALNHPNICALYDIGHEDGRDFLVMELLEGVTLAHRLANRGRLAVDEAVRLATDIASALERAHRKGVVHRDLKPGNVMITSSGAKLLDFGLARLTEQNDEPASAPLTTEGIMIGTIEYMSPEQLNGEPVDARSDIFSFGVLLYEMVTGVRPFSGRNRASVIGSILFGDPQPISQRDADLPPELERLVNACLEKEPDERIQTAHDLRLQLQWSVAGGTRSSVWSKPRRSRVARRTMLFAVAAAFVVGGLAAGMSLWRLRAPEPRQVRFAIHAPVPGEQVDWPVISPDGTRIAFVMENAAGQRSLWVRDLASTTARMLSGTDTATQPFWSPDSSAVAFFSADKLQVARLAGTRPQPLATATSPRGGTWGTSGTLLYTPHINASIWMTTAAGTATKEVTRLEAANRDVTHRWPEFLPDGKHFIFVIRSRNLQRSGLYVGSLENSKLKKISTLQSRAVVAENGWMFFLQDRKLYRQKFDLSRLELKGQPVIIAGNLLPDLKTTGAVRVSVSRAGILTFASPPDMRTSVVQLDRSGRLLRRLAAPGYFVNPALSSDEKTLAISRIDEETGRNSIWLMDTETGAMSPFVADDSNADGPIWTPDGTRILYSSDRRGAYEVYERRVGSVAEDSLVLPSRTYAQPVSVARTGTLFHVARPEGTGAFWFWPEGATGPRQLATGNAGSGAGSAHLSVDGRWIARLNVGSDNSRYGVEITALEDPDRRIDLGGEGGSQPAWRMDGREVFYVDAKGWLTAVEFRDGEIGATTSLFRLPSQSTFYASPDFVPFADGRRFIVLQPVAPQQSSSATVVLNWEAKQ